MTAPPVPSLRPDRWRLVASDVNARLGIAPTHDIRQAAAARALREKVLALLAARAAEAPDLGEHHEGAVASALDALAHLHGVLEAAPPQARAMAAEMYLLQLRVVLALASVAETTEGGR